MPALGFPVHDARPRRRHRPRRWASWGVAVASVLLSVVAVVPGASSPSVAAAGPNCNGSTSSETQLNESAFIGSSTTSRASGTQYPITNVLNGKSSGRFTTGKAQAPGMNYEVNMASAQSFNEVSLNAPDYSGNYPRAINVNVSANGTHWTTLASCSPASYPVTVSFPAQSDQYLEVVLAARASQVWSIEFFYVYGGGSGTTTTTTGGTTTTTRPTTTTTRATTTTTRPTTTTTRPNTTTTGATTTTTGATTDDDPPHYDDDRGDHDDHPPHYDDDRGDHHYDRGDHNDDRGDHDDDHPPHHDDDRGDHDDHPPHYDDDRGDHHDDRGDHDDDRGDHDDDRGDHDDDRGDHHDDRGDHDDDRGDHHYDRGDHHDDRGDHDDDSGLGF